MIEISTKSLKEGFNRLPAPAMIINRKRIVKAFNRSAWRFSGLPAGHVIDKMTCRQVCQCQLPIQDCPLKTAFDESEKVRRNRIKIAPRGRGACVIERIHAFKDSDTGEERAAIVMISRPR